MGGRDCSAVDQLAGFCCSIQQRDRVSTGCSQLVACLELHGGELLSSQALRRERQQQLQAERIGAAQIVPVEDASTLSCLCQGHAARSCPSICH